MIVDGRAIAATLYRETKNQISHMLGHPHLTVFTCAPNLETQKYLSLKKKRAESLGIGVNVIEFPETLTTEEMQISIQHSLMQTDGVVVQLPFPPSIDIKALLEVVPSSYDVDVMHYDGSNARVLPPVVGAIDAIARQHDLLLATQRVVVVGHGRLVGQPAAVWAQKQGAHVTVVTESTPDKEALIKQADILILGAGKAGLIKPDMVKDHVVIFDAGTSEEGGVLRGDADPACAEKSALFTPVPGGIGPITIAVLLQNLVTLCAAKQ